MPPHPTSVLGGADLDLFVARLFTKGVAVLGVLALVVVVQMLRFGLSGRYLLLLAGSLLSIAALYAYAMRVVSERGQPKRSLAGLVVGLGGLIPYLFGCYLVFYEGVWRLRLLLDGFAGSVLVVALMYVGGGYVVVTATYKVTEFARAVSEGRLKLG